MVTSALLQTPEVLRFSENWLRYQMAVKKVGEANCWIEREVSPTWQVVNNPKLANLRLGPVEMIVEPDESEQLKLLDGREKAASGRMNAIRNEYPRRPTQEQWSDYAKKSESARKDDQEAWAAEHEIRKRIATRTLQTLIERSGSSAVPLKSYDEGVMYCAYKGAIYKFNRVGYTSEEMTLQVMESEDRERQEFERLHRKFSLSRQGAEEPKREQIPEEVRVAVWRRDQGQCAKCGSRERLEYDHIVPVSKGGSNTVRNIELMCEKCNREKGSRV